MAITLGKDCTISVDGNLVGVRNVTISQSARTIDIERFGSRYVEVYNTGYDASVSIELNDNTSLGALFASCQNGAEVTVSGGAGGWSFPAVVTGISESDPIDGIRTYTVSASRAAPQ